MRKSFLFHFAAVCLLLYPQTRLLAQETLDPIQVILLLKTLEYDKNFDRYPNPIRIGVTSDETLAVFNSQSEVLTVKGRRFVAEKMNEVADITKYKAIYLDTNWKADYIAVSLKAIESKTLTFARDINIVNKGLAAVGIKQSGSKPEIFIALPIAKAQGAEFDPEFLKFVSIVGND